MSQQVSLLLDRMKYSEIQTIVNADPELRRIAYEAGREVRARQHEQRQQRRSDHALLCELIALGKELCALKESADLRNEQGRIDMITLKAKHDRVREIHGLTAKLRRELSGLS